MSIEELRELAGFSMTEMAMYLGISKGRYSMAAYSKRSLPPEAMSKLEALRQIFEQAQNATLPEKVARQMDEVLEDTRQELRRHARQCTERVKSLAKALEKLLRQKQQWQLAARIPEAKQEKDEPLSNEELILELKRREGIEALLGKVRSKEAFLRLQIEMQMEESLRATKMADRLQN